jgi:HK97 gp10 family phage protein
MNAPVRGIERLIARFDRLSIPRIGAALGKALYATADAVAVDAAISITTGAVSGKGHVPSSPGSPPNADTHMLDRSIEAALVSPLVATATANAPYAAALEYGTSKMAERPYMRPAALKNRDTLRENIAAVVRQANG